MRRGAGLGGGVLIGYFPRQRPSARVSDEYGSNSDQGSLRLAPAPVVLGHPRGRFRWAHIFGEAGLGKAEGCLCGTVLREARSTTELDGAAPV
jgi:hypothetical protein